MEKRFHAISSEDALKELSTTEKGLSQEQANHKLRTHGLNAIEEKDKGGYLIAFLKQFKSFLIYILLVAAVISYFIGHFVDMYVILGIILINAGIGFVQEQKAERSIESLKRMVVAYSKVYRDNQLVKIDSRYVVPGDIVLLNEGDKIPADARLIFVKNFSTVEASLTGESTPVQKDIKMLEEKISVFDRKNCVFMGTFVASGTAKAVVYATGDDTSIGKIAESISKIEEGKTHFREKTDKLAIQMAVIALFGATMTFLVAYFLRDFEFTEVFLFTIASLVSGIPEGLPAILSIVLAIGALRMSKRKAIIRSLPATETLAVVDTIITDKTGTLTENAMNVREVFIPGQSVIEVTGEGWEPKGDFFQGQKIFPEKNKALWKLLKICAVCNNSNVVYEEGHYSIIGDPTEAALLVLAEKAGIKKNAFLKNKIDDIPFNQNLRYRVSVFSEKDKELFVVGALEDIINRSKYFMKGENKFRILKKDKDEIFKQMGFMTKNARRVLGIAYKVLSKSEKGEIIDAKVEELVFVGLVGMIDPPRKEVKDAIAKARMAGVRVIMVTGDHKLTAVSIAKEIGLISGGDKIEALEQSELEKLSANDFKKMIRRVNVFARLTPEMKMKVATCLQADGHKIAMTGDGVNDAPALTKADIGVSMGIIGTDVARESSEIILADDNFSSIIDAIEEGRIVYNNTKQTSFFLITTNFAEDIAIITTLLIGMPLPLLPIQLLWLNLVTDTGAGIGLASEPGHSKIIEEKPKNAKADILSWDIIPFLVLIAIVMTLLTIIIFKVHLGTSIEKARTGAFVVLAFCQLFNSLNMRSLKKSLFSIGVFSNKVLNIGLLVSSVLIVVLIYFPFFHNIFGFAPLNIIEFLILVLASSLVFVFGEGYKAFVGIRNGRKK